MLHLKFALNLEHLADEMIEAISKEWKDPFNAPVVIFPDPKLEQWFRLRWMKKKGVLANLNKSTIDRFLFDILVGKDSRLQKLSSEMLSNVVMAYLLHRDENGKYSYESIDESGQVAKFLTSGGKLDAGRLFDFASRLAGLFLEYETSRPNQYVLGADGKVAKGILDCWSEDLLKSGGSLKDFFVKRTKNEKFEPVENEAWERILYSKIFHNVDAKSLLTQVFENADSESEPENRVKYLTLPFLYKSCLDSAGVPQFNYKSNAPVYILGLSGMGQFYRVVLREFAKQHEVYAYVQNPCMEFWEDLDTSAIVPRVKMTEDGDAVTETEDTVAENENALLRNWGKAGRDNIKLWCLTDDYSSCDFAENEHLQLLDKKMNSLDSLLHAVQYLVANRTNKFDEEELEDGVFLKDAKDESISVTAAPSKLREVEALHSSICKLLLQGVDAKDILVVSPNLQEYSPYIYQIFDQAKTAAENGDKTIVHIPYTIVDSISKDSLVGALLETLFRVRRNGSVSRPDFFGLVSNPIVQETRGITPDMVAVWEKWIVEMNVYRDRPEQEFGKAPWLMATKRMLLARLTSKPLELPEGVCTPYADMDSSNDSILLKFVQVIDDLEKWTCAFGENLSQEEVSALFEMISVWARMKNPSDELVGESAAYKEVCKTLNRLKYFFYAGEKEIPLEVVKASILKVATVSEFSFGNLFVNGISFMKFAPNRVIPVKHLFFLGADADHFPTVDSYNTLDLRKLVRPWPGDDSSISRNRYAFLCQLMCTSDGFHISYQNVNLAKDSEIYPSPVISDLKNFVSGFAKAYDSEGKAVEPLKTESIPLDETRSKEQIFTRRGRRYLESINCLRKIEESGEKTDRSESQVSGNVSAKPADDSSSYPDKVSISQLKNYLNDPFQFYVGRMLRLDKNGDDPTEQYVEPVSLNNLDRSEFVKTSVFIQRGMNMDYSSTDMYFSSLEDQGRIPAGEFGLGVVEEICMKATAINGQLEKFFPKDKMKCLSVELNESIHVDSNREFILQGNLPLLFVSKADETECVIVELGNSVSIGKYLKPYIAALGLLASGKMKKVSLFVAAGNEMDEEDFESKLVQMKLDANAAIELLDEIYRKAFVECWKKVLPIELISKKFESLADLKFALDDGNDHGSWCNFAGKDLFIDDLEKCSGYLPGDDFAAEWSKACDLQKKLLACFEKLLEG